ncbi:MAG: amino acid permease [Methanomassiliicoccales archaeon]|nr:amino acid permease [Methanomassiliicoccales archaeon]NYT15445.1 amino acid permease [Methanomassiliicoccales archaeon]
MNGAKRAEGLSMFSAIAFAVGTMIGAGVFVLSGLVVNIAGPAAVLSYIIGGAIIVFSGLSYAALASIFPEDGGGYLYVKKMLGGFVGFLAGWGMYAFLMIASSFVMIGFGIYLNLLLGTHLDPRILALAGLVALTLLNLRGISEAGKAEISMVVTKVAILLVLVIVGLTHISTSDFSPLAPNGAGSVITGVTMVFFAYTGFQVAAMMAGEVKESSRKVPIAIIISIALVMVIYVGVIVSLMAANLPSYGSESVFDAAVVFLGPLGGTVVALAATISTLSSVNANIVGSSRITMEMASEEQLPGRFARLRNGQPVNSILLGSVISAVFIIWGSLDFIIDTTNVSILATMMLVNISAIIMIRRKEKLPDGKSYFRIPLGALFPALGAISCLLMILLLPPTIILLGSIVLLSGSILYILEDTPRGRSAIEEIKEVLGRY